MRDYYFSCATPHSARETIKGILKNYLKLDHEKISIYELKNSFAAQDYYSQNVSPPTDVAAMDGYAIFAEETFDVTDTNPKVIANYKVVQTGEDVEGFSAVVPFEEVEVIKEGIKLFQSYYPRQNIRQKGEDVQKDQLIVKKGDFVTNFDKVYLKVGGYKNVNVYKFPTVAFLPTGDELVDKIENKGELVEFNSVIFNNLMKRYGFDVSICNVIKNDIADLSKQIDMLTRDYDIVFINAGSSKGDKDLTRDAIKGLGGEVFVHGIAIKPGKPTIIAKLNNRLVIGLPGFPVSMFFALREIFLKAFFEAFELNPKEKSIYATIERRIASDIGSEEYVRVSIENIEGKNVAKVLKRGASIISSLKKADGYIKIPMNVDLIEEGSLLEVILI